MRMMRISGGSRVAIAAVFWFCGTALCTAADPIDEYVSAQMRTLRLPGLSLAIIRDGKLVKAGGYGLADLELRVPAARDTVYEIGSNTKQFTAAAVMMLVEEGTLSLDEGIGKYFANAPGRWRAITIRHLLTHTSGIRNHVAVPGYMDRFRTNLSFETTPGGDDLLRLFFDLPLEFEPAATWAYDNTGYYLLGLLIERVSGRSYWQFLDERIFTPLGMTATRSTDPRPLVPHRASGYEWTGNAYQNRPTLLPGIAFSAGSLLSTVEDLAKWDAALGGDRLLSRASLEQIWTAASGTSNVPLPMNYGFGWFVDEYRGHRIVQHSGGTPGFSSAMFRFLDDRLTIIVLANHGDRILDHLAIDIAGMVVPVLKRPVAATDPDPARTVRVRRVFADLLAGRVDAESFTAPMHTFLKTATGKSLFQWVASHGELSAFTFSDAEPAGANRRLRYRVWLGKTAYWFTVTETADGRIAQIYSS